MCIRHEGTYHGIGQGQFFSGRFDSCCGQFNYLVDCGSSSKKEYLRKEVREYKKSINKVLDLLVISHLDADHFNGIQYLKNTQIGTIVLPYLEPWQKLALCMYNRAKNKEEVKFILNPKKVLEKFEIQYEQIIFVRSKFIEDDRDFIPERDQGKEKYKFYDELNFESLINTTNFKCWKCIDNIIDFKFFRLSIDKQKLQSFLETDINFVNNTKKIKDLREDDIRNILRDNDEKLNNFKKAYEKVRKINDTSLCLAVTKKNNKLITKSLFTEIPEVMGWYPIHRCCINSHCYMNDCMCKFGFIFTGDISLDMKDNFDEFKDYYRDEFKEVLIFTVPHHGSKKSWNQGIVKYFKNNLYVVSSAHNNRYNHPHPCVISEIIQANNILFWVKEGYSLKVNSALF